MSKLQEALDLIFAQQQKLPEYSPAAMVGHQLAEIIKAQPAAADIVLVDLQGKGMALTDCEHKIKAWADAHKNGQSGVCVPPDKAEQIIREFYGLQNLQVEKEPRRAPLNLADFL